jgi:uncharacterized membrane protein YidH (DUF202 family)
VRRAPRRRAPRAPWDPGLQNERTALAWMRSGLALLVAALVLARISAELRTTVGLGLSAGCVILAAGVVTAAPRRYERAAVALHERRPLPDGRVNAAMSALAALLGVAATVIVLVH